MGKFRSTRAPEPGFFEQLAAWKNEAKAAGRDVIDLSVGISDLPCPPEALETLRESTYDTTTYSYCLKHNTMPLLEAACDWYYRRYNVRFDPRTECLSVIGSQEGLAHLLMAVADHGDTIIMCDTAYPSYWGALQLAGLHTTFLSLDEETGLPDFDRVKPEQLDRAKAVLLNYPNNPTAVTATNEFFEKAIKFCQQHGLLLIHDNPYVDQVYEGTSPSPLALPGGREVCVELFSFSKSYHIAGFRLGFVLGAPEAIAALEAVKAPIDFNTYIGIQRMGITCLSLPEERVKAHAQIWRRRAETLVKALEEKAGWKVRMPISGMYLWAKLPSQWSSRLNATATENGYSNGHTDHESIDASIATKHTQPQGTLGATSDDVQFVKALLAATGVALSPGSGFGPGGRGNIRVALVLDEAILRTAAERIGEFLATIPQA